MFNVCKRQHKRLAKNKKIFNSSLDLLKKKLFNVFKTNNIVKTKILVNVKLKHNNKLKNFLMNLYQF